MIKTEAGELMKQQNPMENIDKADENADGVIDGQELLRQELMKQGNIVGAPDMPEMNCGGLMGDGMGVIIGIEETSGNEIPAGSKPEEVADDIPAMLSEGEYVIPADVVRWHGLKNLEMMRQEAKMGLGLMAQDGRIAMVDDDTKEPVEYEIEEDDKPEVEEAKVKVVEAAEGKDVQVDDTETTEPEPILPFYQLRYITDSDTGRTRMAYVDPVTGQEVSPETYEESRASRFAPQTVLEQQGIVEKVSEDIADEEEDEATTPSCPVGQVFNPTTGQCEDISGDGPESGESQSLFDSTRDMAERLGATYVDDPEAALARATRENKALSMKGAGTAGSLIGAPILGVVINEAVRYADAVGAQRALLGREQYLGISDNITDGTLSGKTVSIQTDPNDPTTRKTYESGGLKYTGPQTYNFTMREDGSIDASSGGARISEISKTDDGRDWVSDYEHVDKEGNVVDPFSDSMTDEEFASWIETIDDNDGNTGRGGSVTNEAGESVTSGDGSDVTSRAVGGYISKTNTPKTAMIKY